MDHFQKHRHEFSFQTDQEYEEAAIALFAADLSATLLECVRPSCDFVRLDMVFDYFGVMAINLFICTLYRPRPRSGETRRDYFNRQCSKN